MDIELSNDDTFFTWFDMIRNHIGKQVAIFTRYPSAFTGTLEDFNGYVLKLTSNYDKSIVYFPVNEIIVIKEMVNEH